MFSIGITCITFGPWGPPGSKRLTTGWPNSLGLQLANLTGLSHALWFPNHLPIVSFPIQFPATSTSWNHTSTISPFWSIQLQASSSWNVVAVWDLLNFGESSTDPRTDPSGNSSFRAKQQSWKKRHPGDVWKKAKRRLHPQKQIKKSRGA